MLTEADVAPPSERSRVAKTIEFERDEADEVEALRLRHRRRSFTDAARLAIRHGLQRIAELEAEGKLVA